MCVLAELALCTCNIKEEIKEAINESLKEGKNTLGDARCACSPQSH